jgi:hypothetical protein
MSANMGPLFVNSKFFVLVFLKSVCGFDLGEILALLAHNPKCHIPTSS